jgi:hypothetical protein
LKCLKCGWMSPAGSEYCVRCKSELATQVPPQEIVRVPEPETPFQQPSEDITAAPSETAVPPPPVPPTYYPTDRATETPDWYQRDVPRRPRGLQQRSVRGFAVFFFIALAVIIAAGVYYSIRAGRVTFVPVEQPVTTQTTPVTSPAAATTVPSPANMSSTSTWTVPVVSRIQPEEGVQDTALTVTIQGNGFREDSTVYMKDLQRQMIIPSFYVQLISDTAIKADFNLQGLPAGTYEVVVKNGDASSRKTFFVRPKAGS